MESLKNSLALGMVGAADNVLDSKLLHDSLEDLRREVGTLVALNLLGHTERREELHQRFTDSLSLYIPEWEGINKPSSGAHHGKQVLVPLFASGRGPTQSMMMREKGSSTTGMGRRVAFLGS